MSSGQQNVNSCTGNLNPPSDDFEYKLSAPPGQGQVEPTSSFWLTGHALTVPRIYDVLNFSEGNKAKPRWHVTQDDFPTEAQLSAQLNILRQLVPDRNNFPPYPAGKQYSYNGETLTLAPLSRFIQLQPPPFGAIFDVVNHPTVGIGRGEVNEQHLRILERHPVVGQGQELARLFESETPGLYHRHALNWIFYARSDVSPVRQARVWFALDMAIYTALSTAWYYKWSHPSYSRLLRPSEYAGECEQNELNVLFDRTVDNNGREVHPTQKPGEKPGTPRHPAWPSGHSTFSAAASHILEYFFSPDTLEMEDDDIYQQSPPGSDDINNPVWVAAELRRLASNIGQARLWGGVHWVSDHVAGQKIGRAAAQAVAEQFSDDCIAPFGSLVKDPPDRPTLDQIAADARNCPSGDPEARRHDFIPQRPDRQTLRNLSAF